MMLGIGYVNKVCVDRGCSMQWAATYACLSCLGQQQTGTAAAGWVTFSLCFSATRQLCQYNDLYNVRKGWERKGTLQTHATRQPLLPTPASGICWHDLHIHEVAQV